jgi:hypothetical protein
MTDEKTADSFQYDPSVLSLDSTLLPLWREDYEYIPYGSIRHCLSYSYRNSTTARYYRPIESSGTALHYACYRPQQYWSTRDTTGLVRKDDSIQNGQIIVL